MKKLTSLLFSLILVFTLATGVHAQQPSTTTKAVTVSINGEQIQFGNPAPFVEKGTTLVPAHQIFDALQYEVSWDEENEIIVAEKYGVSLALKIGEPTAYINGHEVPLTVAPQVKNDTVFIPLRFISEAIGFTVDWNGAANSVALVKLPSKGYIWKVEKDGVELYLAGSIHLGDTKMYPLRDEIEQAFENSDKLVVEVNIAKEPDQQTLELINKLQTYSDNTTLKDHVSAETYARIQGFLNDLQLEPTAYDAYKPWAVYVDMTNYQAAVAGYQGGLGVDLYFINRAQLENKPILELESYASQFEAFSSFSKELQEELVNVALDSIYGINQAEELTNPPIEILAESWINGDDKALEDLVAVMEETPEFYEKMLPNRHVGMLEKIEGYLNNDKNEDYFVVVGYLHLLGKDGLVTKLKEKGYNVTRI